MDFEMNLKKSRPTAFCSMKIVRHQDVRFLWRNAIFLIFLLLATCFTAFGQSNQRVDILIKNATVFDGTGAAGVRADVGIRGDKIVFVGQSGNSKIKSKETIDANGWYLTPGFIDSHTHYGKWLKSKNAKSRVNLPCLSQGVTTVFLGSDGFGTYRIKKELDAFEKNGIGTNVAVWVGFSTVRKAVLGSKNISPTPQQLQKERELVAQGMQEGALGLSTGLFYTPQNYSKTDEVIELAKVAKKYGGTYDSHIRSESDDLLDAIYEIIRIGKEADIPVHISHIKNLGPAAWGKSGAIIEAINKAQNENTEIKACQYPFLASHTSLSAMLMPQWAKSGGTKAMLQRFENPDTLRVIMKELSLRLAIRGGDSRIVLTSSDASFNGKTLHDVATELSLPPEEAAIAILKKHPGIGGNSYSMVEGDLKNYMQQPWVMTCSDGGSKMHPRTYASFTKKITQYVMKDSVLTMADAVHKATGETAAYFGLKQRGLIKEGYYADIVLMDPASLKDNADYMHPERLTTGIKYVFVNGKKALVNDQPTGTLAGQPIKR